MVSTGIGVGKVKDVGATFTQKVSIEKGIATVGKDGTIGIGATLANAYGGVSEVNIPAVYDYKVPTTMYTYQDNGHGRWMTSSYAGATIHRQGFGTADAKFAREDLKLTLNGSYHHALTGNFEVYATFGVGVALMNQMCGRYDNYRGFESKTKTNDINTSKKQTQYSLTYSYDDKEHANFDDYSATKAGCALSLYAGARYSFTSTLAAFAEIGLVSGSINKKLGPKGLDVFTLGVSYKL